VGDLVNEFLGVVVLVAVIAAVILGREYIRKRAEEDREKREHR
jgi:hypothetical protein